MSASSDRVPLKLPPPLIFLLYLGSALILNLVIPVREPWISWLQIVGAISVLLGLGLGALAVLSMRRAHTSPDPHQPAATLVTGGPYRYTRNPIYLGFLLIALGFTLLAGTLWGLILSPVLVWAVTTVIIRAEERYLAPRFAEGYADYKARARRWI